MTVRYKSLSSGTFFVALRKPKTCKKGQLRFSMWGEGIKTLRYKGTARCGFNSRVYRMGSGISGALNDYSDGSDRYSDVTFTIGGRERYTVVRRVKWRLSFAGRSLGQGRVLFKRTYRAGRPNTRVYWDEDPDRYWRYDVCLRYGNDPARNMMAYCVWPGTPSRWSSHVGRW